MLLLQILESLQIDIVMWGHCVWNDNFTIYLLTAYCENAESCQIMLPNVYCNIFFLIYLWGFLVFLIPTSECLFLLERRRYREATNQLPFLTWQHFIGQILPTDDVKWKVGTNKTTEKERSFTFTFLVAIGTAVKWHYRKCPEIH